ncbi:MAG: hypothetical protein HS105_06935 [Chloracidobacterium sp.]|nr:hypothetical protein [Chloracidobacterium sp.]MCC6824241.1 hypothetical protein [Acidobacteriota bacterium]MCO5334355.1 hypothetical protein [Pyrinomonadaceae bacterium]
MKKILLGSIVTAILTLSVAAQKTAPKAPPKAPKPIVFAVLNDGRTTEPIAYINKGKLEPPVNGSDAADIIAAFNKTYYKPGTVYRLIFGGVDSGTVRVKSSDANAECTKNMATVTTQSTRSPLKGLVMGLATNAPITNKAFFRRKPTNAEKAEVEALVRSEYARHKLSPKVLKYLNLTGIDIDKNGNAEFVGTYWTEIDKLTRGLLFFIAEKNTKGKYVLSFSDFRTIDQAGTMSGDIKAIDEGVYQELFLDSFDYDGDGIGEIFTYVEAFEGSGFTAYKKANGKWTRAYENSNYHCGY